ncbi:MAG TPA: hypothetical protein PL001_07145, partial [Candidatus Kryptobacter bacterium]|nr:hypothetical protein [Candidatus Kryptobacter bacterium]
MRKFGGRSARRRVASVVSLIPIVCFFFFGGAYAQQGQVINLTASAQAVENSPVAVKAEVRSLTNISRALLFYRNDLSMDF